MPSKGKKKECPSCAMEINDDAKVCPVCSYEFPATVGAMRWIAVALILLAILFVIFAL